ncbi:MAG: YicC family protein [Proteobacteria bacterium]|nr:YicC family protein [Pseudomonadota bacterium]
MQSMTGFGRATFGVGGAAYRVELRSLNSRFLDLKVRLPWFDGELETRISAAVRERLARGRVDLALWDDQAPAGGGASRLDHALALRAAAALDELAELCGGDRACAATLLGPVAGIFTLGASRPESAALWEGSDAKGLRHALGAALDQLLVMRAREGAALATELRQQLVRLRTLAAKMAPLAAEEPSRRQRLLAGRLAQLAASPVDPQRLAQEVAILAERADVSEELARLESHFDQLEAVLGAAEPIGRRLEFLLQEVHRELNTLATKATSAELGVLVLDAKSWLEKMREQAQNVE